MTVLMMVRKSKIKNNSYPNETCFSGENNLHKKMDVMSIHFLNQLIVHIYNTDQLLVAKSMQHRGR